MMLDALGSIAPFFYLLASYFESIPVIYAVTLLQASIAALYEPCRASIVVLMVGEGEYMKKATTLTGLSWSAMAAIGSGFGGYAVSKIGINACFVVDSFSFAVSGLLLYMIGGQWTTSSTALTVTLTHLSAWKQIEDMTMNGLRYIKSSPFWPLIFIRTTTCLIYGGSDIINVSFAEEDPSLSEAEQSQRLGTLMFMVGFGCLVGPLISERFTNMSNPRTVLVSCIIGFAFEGIGCLGMFYFTPFRCTAFFTMIRAGGSCISWVDGQVLLQKFVKPEMLGRVIALDYGFALAAEGSSSMIAGLLQDDLGLSARQVSLIMGVLACVFFGMWLIYGIFCSNALFESKDGGLDDLLSLESDGGSSEDLLSLESVGDSSEDFLSPKNVDTEDWSAVSTTSTESCITE